VNRICQGRCKLPLLVISTQSHDSRCAVRFTTGSEQDIKKTAHVQIFNSRLYDDSVGRYVPALFGPLDNRLVFKNECFVYILFI
jgi:hypothetical protein